MSRHTEYDAVVVGSGPNGLAAAIALAETGLSAAVYERAAAPGGGLRSSELTLPGFVHDVCSAVHPLAAGSPFLARLPLQAYGLDWVHPPIAYAHPLDDGSAAAVWRSMEDTAGHLAGDRAGYLRLMAPLVRGWAKLFPEALAPLHFPRHPAAMARLGMRALRSARGVADAHFRSARGRALFAGAAAHGVLPLDRPVSAAAGLVLGAAAHTAGWPMPRGGAQRLANALAAHARTLGVEISLNREIRSLEDLPPARAVLLDLSPRQVLDIAGTRLPEAYRKRLAQYRHGPGVCKVDWALREPIPFTAPECRRAGVVHVGGTFAEVAEAERLVWAGKHPERPFVLLAQPTLFDLSRAPAGRHTAWGYCHVPNGSTIDMTGAIEAQIERFAPGFREVIIGRHTLHAADMERYNPNYVGGDITGGVLDARQLFTRPAGWRAPYRTPLAGVYICSASTPPGGGVHGMCGYHAAILVLKDLFGGGRPGRADRRRL
ncbi:MAG TPA: NAD(P)/FAD-dependent oxidoreductase [candidate division Zixibacteria bacterium]|nr:NAD(P)/FAD-dependent oxidoreductase [candidate division Zixibacteria bacterium]